MTLQQQGIELDEEEQCVFRRFPDARILTIAEQGWSNKFLLDLECLSGRRAKKAHAIVVDYPLEELFGIVQEVVRETWQPVDFRRACDYWEVMKQGGGTDMFPPLIVEKYSCGDNWSHGDLLDGYHRAWAAGYGLAWDTFPAIVVPPLPAITDG